MYRRLTTAEIAYRLGACVGIQFMSVFFFLEDLSARYWLWVGIFGILAVLSTRQTITESNKWKEPR
jgi:hypothetical protein